MKRWMAMAVVGLVACGDDGSGMSAMDAGPSGFRDAGPIDAFVSPYCRTGEDRPSFEPDEWAESADGPIEAGAAAVSVTPDFGPATEVVLMDVNGNGSYDPEDGDTFRDTDGDGVFDGVWIGGYGNGRPASGVNDEQWARAIALRNGETTVVLVAVETPILFIDEVEAVREMVADLGIDYVGIASTHCHQCRDNIGFWGPAIGENGRDDAYNAFLREQMAAAVREAHGALRPAHVQYATTRLRDAPGGVFRYVSDSRDPVILDDRVTLARFVEAAPPGATIATLIDWAAHAEYMGSDNTLLSSDHPNWLRAGIEDGEVGPGGMMRPGVGGVAVFFQGAIGSQIGPGRLRAETWDGEMLPSHSLRTSETVGRQVAWLALGALADGGGSVTDETARLGFRRFTFLVDLENRAFHLGVTLGLFDREACNWNPEMPLVAGHNEPDVKTEVAVIDIGRMQILFLPGELDPSEWVGGFDGSWTPEGIPMLQPGAENPPDLSMAPDGPFLHDLMRADAEYRIVVGLGGDYAGYFVPEYDYELQRSLPYIGEPPGSHYEETRSLGPETWPEIRGYIHQLLAWTPP